MKHSYLLYFIVLLCFTACRKDQQRPTIGVWSAPSSSPSSSDSVLTPGGWRSAARVTRVNNGEHISVADGRLSKVSDATGRVVRDLGAVVNDDPLAKRVLPLASGWITYTYWTNTATTPITYFSTTWTVPPAPSTNNGQTIFLFNGLQNNSYILQPVLQWGPSAAGGGNYWALANWYVGSDGSAVYSNLVRVNPGTVLTGIMTQVGTTGSNYNYTSAFSGYPAITITVNNIQKLYWAAESLEVYSPAVCTDYPNTAKTRLSNIEIRRGTAQAPLSWSVANAVTDCGQHSTVVTNGSPNGIVDIYY
jgi:hypothetical protein